MSFSDEAVPAEEVAPDPALVTDENSDDGVADSEIELEAEADPMGLLKRERDEYLVALQRTQADFENYRKRIQRMQEEQSARAASALVHSSISRSVSAPSTRGSTRPSATASR